MVGDPSKSQSRPLASAAQFMSTEEVLLLYLMTPFIFPISSIRYSTKQEEMVLVQLSLPVMGAGTDTRYADGVFDRKHHRLVIVREHHPVRGKRDAINSLVSIDPRSSSGKEEILVAGNDFYSFPRLNHNESKLAWISWNFPNMPFDGAELWVGDLDSEG